MNFLMTKDLTTADTLRKNGFTELNKDGKYFVFVNNGKIDFSENKNIVYTNKINI